jgi:chemotaxis protein MotB
MSSKSRRHHRSSGEDFSGHVWPGFVDALSVVLVAVLLCFMVVVVSHVSTQKMVTRHQNSRLALQTHVSSLTNQHSAQQRLIQSLQRDKSQLSAANQEMTRHMSQLLEDNQRLATLNQTAQDNLTRISENNQEQAKEISTLSKKLEEQLRKQLENLKNARSLFFEQLKKALSNRKEIRVVGDRFIFASEVLFEKGSAMVNSKGAAALKNLCHVLQEVIRTLPDSLAWVLRVDGHTDQTPVRQNSRYASNLELSTARAISVVNFLIQQGFPSHRLAAAGFGSFRPLVTNAPSDKDRRIELLLDQGY